MPTIASGFPAPTFATLRAYVDAQDRHASRARERPVYALVSMQEARPGLAASALDCAAQMRAMDRGEKIQGRPCGVSPYPGRLMARGITMADLASLITPWVDRPVIDRTGLMGVFDVDVEGVEVKPAGPFGPSYRPSNTKDSIFNTRAVAARPAARTGDGADRGADRRARGQAPVALRQPYGSKFGSRVPGFHGSRVSLKTQPWNRGTLALEPCLLRSNPCRPDVVQLREILAQVTRCRPGRPDPVCRRECRRRPLHRIRRTAHRRPPCPRSTRPKGTNGSLSCVSRLSRRLITTCVVRPLGTAHAKNTVPRTLGWAG